MYSILFKPRQLKLMKCNGIGSMKYAVGGWKMYSFYENVEYGKIIGAWRKTYSVKKETQLSVEWRMAIFLTCSQRFLLPNILLQLIVLIVPIA